MDYTDPPSHNHTEIADNDIDEDLWASPSTTAKPGKGARIDKDKLGADDRGTLFDKEEARQAALHDELSSVRRVNEAIEGVIESLTKAKANMKTVNSTVSSASALLNTWTRILSQTEHNQRVILNPAWQGASQDIVNMEQEAVAKQQAAERREVEEQMRREEKTRQADEDARRTEATASKPTPRGTGRGRTKGGGRGSTHIGPSTVTNSGHGGFGAPGGSRGKGPPGHTRRPSGRLGRGSTAGRGRTRGP